ncbi:hypothetical protein [Reinekea blandensis]|uniref:Uncharacterized protein n=1 Tax=Reinekea blandensis MED297 TaxID=314283 RepID=A4BJ75_9GAMM|nr:hypothetical protein [Reinekea blandensis]EAR07828.1 hypothetical protein MED297_05269 [Reinekea sp. MED297] [Reinekea blandensis MED297]
MAKQPEDYWPDERRAIKAVQIAFDISTDAQRRIKTSAIKADRTPSDQIRSILGLPVKKPVRPRLTISLSADEMALLAERYGIDPADHLAIKERAAQELLQWSQTSSAEE